jgi:hypothetical protein
MHTEFCTKLNFLEGEYAITQNIGFLLSWVSTPCHAGILKYVVLLVRPRGLVKKTLILRRPSSRCLTRCEILDQLRLEITYQYAINHIEPLQG